MNYNSLIKENKIKRIKATKEEIRNLFELAERDFETAKFVMGQDWDWAFAIAYNSVLQACRAFMFNEGFRTRAEEAHKITFEFMKIALGKEYEALVAYFDRARIKRHKTIYQSAGAVTETELKQFLEKAKGFAKFLKEQCL